VPGVRRFDLDPADAAANVRALVESQMLAMARHSKWMGDRVDVIHATGGAAANQEILQVMADVFGADVWRIAAGNSAALGAAVRAFHADRQGPGHVFSWDEAIAGFVVRAGPPVHPAEEHAATYARLSQRHALCESSALTRSS
jgi:xylulokinase